MAPYLPDELVDNIVKDFAVETPEFHKAERKTLRSLALVNKQYYRVVQPYLYRDVRAGRRGRSAELLRTLCDKPWLGVHVRTLIASRTALTDHPPDNLKHYIFDFPLKDIPKRQRMKHFKANFTNALTYMPNLEVLDVSKYKHKLKEALPPWLLLMQAAQLRTVSLPGVCSVVPNFDSLKRLDAYLHDIPIIELYSVFALPNMEILNFTGGRLMMVSSSLDAHTRGRYRDGWQIEDCKVKHLSFRGLIPGPRGQDTAGLALMAIAVVPNLNTLIFVGAMGHGFGANLYRYILSMFLVLARTAAGAHTLPAFRRIELWDEEPTKPDKWKDSHYWNVWTVLTTMNVDTLIVDHNIPAVNWIHSVDLPMGIKTLHIASASLSSSGTSQATLSLLIVNLKHGIAQGRFPTLEYVKFHFDSHDSQSTVLLLDRKNLVFDHNGVAVQADIKSTFRGKPRPWLV